MQVRKAPRCDVHVQGCGLGDLSGELWVGGCERVVHRVRQRAPVDRERPTRTVGQDRLVYARHGVGERRDDARVAQRRGDGRADPRVVRGRGHLPLELLGEVAGQPALHGRRLQEGVGRGAGRVGVEDDMGDDPGVVPDPRREEADDEEHARAGCGSHRWVVGAATARPGGSSLSAGLLGHRGRGGQGPLRGRG